MGTLNGRKSTNGTRAVSCIRTNKTSIATARAKATLMFVDSNQSLRGPSVMKYWSASRPVISTTSDDQSNGLRSLRALCSRTTVETIKIEITPTPTTDAKVIRVEIESSEGPAVFPYVELRAKVQALLAEQPVTAAYMRYRLTEDNGPGIVKAQIPKIFAKLLYGSKFHRLKQSRGQQGIGISAAGLYGQLTTGKAVVITSKTGRGRPAFKIELRIATKRNQPAVVSDVTTDWDKEHGTRVEIELAAVIEPSLLQR